mmetsp:Transcript_22043/g.32570  ORF Transcript_22043/g.32570 Transcript_22043/m.32570 type:complete len:228 (-) Transcript_22043:621-1304(-)
MNTRLNFTNVLMFNDMNLPGRIVGQRIEGDHVGCRMIVRFITDFRSTTSIKVGRSRGHVREVKVLDFVIFIVDNNVIGFLMNFHSFCKRLQGILFAIRKGHHAHVGDQLGLTGLNPILTRIRERPLIYFIRTFLLGLSNYFLNALLDVLMTKFRKVNTVVQIHINHGIKALSLVSFRGQINTQHFGTNRCRILYRLPQPVRIRFQKVPWSSNILVFLCYIFDGLTIF